MLQAACIGYVTGCYATVGWLPATNIQTQSKIFRLRSTVTWLHPGSVFRCKRRS